MQRSAVGLGPLEFIVDVVVVSSAIGGVVAVEDSFPFCVTVLDSMLNLSLLNYE